MHKPCPAQAQACKSLTVMASVCTNVVKGERRQVGPDCDGCTAVAAAEGHRPVRCCRTESAGAVALADIVQAVSPSDLIRGWVSCRASNAGRKAIKIQEGCSEQPHVSVAIVADIPSWSHLAAWFVTQPAKFRPCKNAVRASCQHSDHGVLRGRLAKDLPRTRLPCVSTTQRGVQQKGELQDAPSCPHPLHL